MPNMRILYVPWPESEAGSVAHLGRGFLTNIHKAPNKVTKNWHLFFYDPKQQDYLSGLDKSDQIYVLGHGGQGKMSIFTEEKKPLLRATYELVCERLKENGLRNDFSGKIKFYNCSGAAGADGKTGPESFAASAARLLRGSGFGKCKIFGYSAPVSNPDEHGKKHHGRIHPDGSMFWVEKATAVRVEFGVNGEALLPVVPVVPVVEERDEWFGALEDPN